MELSLSEDWDDVVLFLSHEATISVAMHKMAGRSFLVMLGMPDDCVVCGGDGVCVCVWWKNEGRTKRCTSLACMVIDSSVSAEINP